MSFTRFRSTLRNWLAPLTFFSLGTVGLVSLPSVYDTTVSSPSTTVLEADTTYGSGMIVILKPIICSAEACYFSGPVPDQYVTLPGPFKDYLLLLTYEPGFGTALDSATVDSIWSAWGRLAPYVYAMDVPGAPTIGFDTTGALMHVNYESYASVQEMYSSGDFNAEWLDTSSQHIDTTEYFPGLTQSVRYDFSYPDSASTIAAHSIGHGFYISGWSQPPYLRDVWIETAIKFTANYSGIRPLWGDRCCGAQKLFHSFAPDQFTRYLLSIWTNGSANAYSASSVAEAPDASLSGDFGNMSLTRGMRMDSMGLSDETGTDTAWHKWRVFIKASTDSTTADGYVLYWLDDKLILPDTTWIRANPGATHTDTLFALPEPNTIRQWNVGRNKDGGGYYSAKEDLPFTESMWVGYTTVWANETPPAWYATMPRPSYAEQPE